MSLTCADCSSLGQDTWVGQPGQTHADAPKTGTCGSCGGPWPAKKKCTCSEAHFAVAKFGDDLLLRWYCTGCGLPCRNQENASD